MATTKQRVLGMGKAWVLRGLRVSVASSLVMAAFGLVAVRVSYARAAEAGMEFGDQLRSIGEHHLSGDVAGDAYEVELNGQSFSASSIVSPLPMHDVLDYFQAECQKDGQGLAAKFAHLDPMMNGLAPTEGVPGFLTMRREQPDRGFVFCLAGDHELKGQELLHRIKSASGGEFSRVGDVRYVSVRRDGNNSDVEAAWTHGKFNIAAMFPKTGDAPGIDIGNVPRPDGSRRILTGTIGGASYGVNSFELQGEPAAALNAVDAKLLAAGWTADRVPANIAEKVRFYSMGTATDVAVSAEATDHGKTDVSYVVSRALGTTAATH